MRKRFRGSARRANDELGWTPRRSSLDALVELLDGIADAANASSLQSDPSG